MSTHSPCETGRRLAVLHRTLEGARHGRELGGTTEYPTTKIVPPATRKSVVGVDGLPSLVRGIPGEFEPPDLLVRSQARGVPRTPAGSHYSPAGRQPVADSRSHCCTDCCTARGAGRCPGRNGTDRVAGPIECCMRMERGRPAGAGPPACRPPGRAPHTAVTLLPHVGPPGARSPPPVPTACGAGTGAGQGAGEEAGARPPGSAERATGSGEVTGETGGPSPPRVRGAAARPRGRGGPGLRTGSPGAPASPPGP